jgi:hypothetical protein
LHRLRVFENRVLWRIFGPKRDEVTGELRRLHSEKLYALYSSPNVFRVSKPRRMRWAEHVARMEAKRGAYRVVVGKPEGRSSLGKPRRRWQNNNIMDIQKVRGGSGVWTGWIWLTIGTGGGLL